MALGTKGLTWGLIKGLIVCRDVCGLHCKHTALDGCAVHSHLEQCARAD
ncbi:unnamed protein product, partial [Staurois parvus]